MTYLRFVCSEPNLLFFSPDCIFFPIFIKNNRILSNFRAKIQTWQLAELQIGFRFSHVTWQAHSSRTRFLAAQSKDTRLVFQEINYHYDKQLQKNQVVLG